VPELEIRERPPSMLRNVNVGPPVGAGAEIRERPPSTLRNIDAGPPGGAEAEDPERPPSTLRNVDGVPPRGCCRDFRQRPPSTLEASIAGPLGVLSGFPAMATTKVEDVDDGPAGGAVERSGSGHHRNWRRRWRAP
jgi:hypothetical protein